MGWGAAHGWSHWVHTAYAWWQNNFRNHKKVSLWLPLQLLLMLQLLLLYHKFDLHSIKLKFKKRYELVIWSANPPHYATHFNISIRCTHTLTHTLIHTYTDSGSPSHANRWPLGDVSPLWQAAGTCRQTTCKCAPLSTRSLVNLSASLSLPLPLASSTIATARHNVQSVKSVKLILKLIRYAWEGQQGRM